MYMYIWQDPRTNILKYARWVYTSFCMEETWMCVSSTYTSHNTLTSSRQVREQSSEEEEEEGVTEEHEVTESEGDDDSGEDLFSSFSADVLHSLSLSTGRGCPRMLLL